MAAVRSPISSASGQAARMAARMAGGIFAARIVVGDDGEVGLRRHGRAHQRALAGIAVAAGAEHADQPARGVRPQRRQQPGQRVRRVRVVDIDGGAVVQPCRQLHPAAHADEGRQAVEHTGLADGDRETGREQHVVGLEAARQRERDAVAATVLLELDHLAVGAGHGAQQAQRGALLADRQQRRAANRSDGTQGGQGHRVHVRIRHGRGAVRQQLGEQAQLALAIRLQRGVVVQVVARQIGEAGGGELHAIQAELRQPVRGGLQRRVRHTVARQRSQRFGNGNRVGRGERGTAGNGAPTVHGGSDDAERAEAGRLVPDGEDLAQEVDGAGLAVGAGDGERGRRLRAGMDRGELRQPPARFAILDQRARRHAGRPFRARRRQHGGGATRHRLGNEAAAVLGGPGQCCEQEAGADLAAVGGDARQVHRGRVMPARVAGRVGEPYEHLSEPQGE